jgi:GH18 family chitinase
MAASLHLKPRARFLRRIFCACLWSSLAGALIACAEKGPVMDAPPPADTLQMETHELEPTQAAPDSFRVIAYVTSAVIPELIPYGRLTHINYSFLIPNADGSFATIPNGWKLEKIVDEAHRSGVKVLISVGGWGWDHQFETLASEPVTRAAFVENLTRFVEEYDLDGADVDWEYPNPGESARNFLALISELRAAMPGKLITTAVVSYGDNGEGVVADTFPLFDFINVMTYDGSDHGSMAQFEAGMDYWGERGLPPEKMVMGVPFYSQPQEASYRKLVEADPEAAYTDTTERYGAQVRYNGIPTIQSKTQLAMDRAGGIMFWTLEHDALDDLSLLKAIDEVVKQE